MANNVPITEGTGTSSIAAEQIGVTKYQQIKVVGGETGSTSVWGITPDGSAKVSVIGVIQTNTTGSIVAIPTGNQSVSGTIGGSIIGQLPAGTAVLGSVATLQGTNPWNIAGSVAAFQAGTHIASISGNVTVVSSIAGGIFPISGSVAAVVTNNVTVVSSIAGGIFPVSGSVSAVVTNFPTTQNVSGSVVATQGTTPWLIGSVYGNISGSVAATVTNTVTVVSSISGGIFPISGSVAATVTNTNLNVGGSVVAFQGAGWSGSVAAWLQSSNASVITVGQGSIAVNIIAGSIAATFTPPANQSVSGTVQTDVRSSVAVVIIGGSVAVATGNSSVQLLGGSAVIGSVTTLQGTNPWIVSSSIAGGIFPISGSVAATITNTNVNVSGSIAAWLNSSNASVITVGQGSIAVNIIAGSIAATFTPPANQSVSGTVQTDVRASVAVVIIGGSVATATTNSSVFLLNSPNTIGSVIAYQGTPSWNVSGSVVAFQAGTQITSVSGAVTVSEGADTPSATASILVGVTANTNGSVLTTTGYQTAMMQITSGPGASITGQINFEGTLDGTQFVPINGYNPATNAIASAAGVESNWAFNVAGLQGIRGRVSNWSVGSITARAVASPEDARPLAIAAHSVSGTVNLGIGGTMIGSVVAYQGVVPWAVAGSVAAFQAGTWSQSVMTLQITSIATAGQVMGSVATLQGTNPWNVAGSVAAFVVGSSSIITTNVGSVITIQQAQSIVGTYSVAGTHAAGDKGLYILGARNDALASILGADGTFVNPTIGPIGETIVANSPITKWVSGTASMLGGVPMTCSVTVIAAQGASIFTYITGVQVANMGSASVLVSFGGATSSYIGYTIAPAGGGSNITFPNALKTSPNAAFSASISGTASIYVAAQGFISKT